jgi:NifU-like protein involved in Fe-S cluster formation
MDYSSEVWQRFTAPARAGDIAPQADDVVEGAAEDRSLSVWVRFQVQVSGAQIERVRFRAYGCPHVLAAADRVAERLEGQPLAALDCLDMQAVAADLDVPREKFGKLLRIEDALMACRTAAEQRKD